MVDFNEIHDPERWVLGQRAVRHYLGAVLRQVRFEQIEYSNSVINVWLV